MSSARVRMAGIALVGVVVGWVGGQLSRSHAEAKTSGAQPPHPSSAAPPRSIVAPMVSGITVDGETDERSWQSAALAGAFVDERGASARPYSDVRVARDEQYVYLTLYCADEDLHASDSMHVALGAVSFDAHPTGTLDSAPEGVKAAAEVDGTIDDARDDDEEWVVEVAIPIARVGPAPIVALSAKRCDALKDGSVRCGRLERSVRLRD